MKAYVFPGQGAQFPGMAKSLSGHGVALDYFSLAREILGFDIYQSCWMDRRRSGKPGLLNQLFFYTL
jgi:malonyl CoA-acyl carrier protein transacylase